MAGNDGRDSKGRWKPGYCPNPKGRPRKKPPLNASDVTFFKDSLVTARIKGEEREITRHGLLLHAMYEQAISGKSVMLARHLLQRFEESDELTIKAELELQKMGREILDLYEKNERPSDQQIMDYARLYKPLRGRDFFEDPPLRNLGKPIDDDDDEAT